MKISVQQMLNAFEVLTAIVNDEAAGRRKLPQKGIYRVVRMRSKLEKEYEIANGRLLSLIAEHGGAKVVIEATADTPAREMMQVPPDRMEEFMTAWKPLADELVEYEVEAIPLSQLDLGGQHAAAVRGSELIILGDLVRDDG